MSSSFTIFPAIDLRHGRVVRLQHGDPQRQTLFRDDPLDVAQRWLDAGSSWLHVVNLDGAFDETGRANRQLLPQLVQLGGKLQFGGGLRSLDDVSRVLDLGVDRAILGTVAIEKPQLVAVAVARYGPERIAVGIDARDGRVKIHGWRSGTALSPAQLAAQAKRSGVTTIIYTDIARDGVLAGVNGEATVRLAQDSGLQVIASGGVSSLADVLRTREMVPMGIVGLIIGRALYDGRVDLRQALEIAER